MGSYLFQEVIVRVLEDACKGPRLVMGTGYVVKKETGVVTSWV